MPKNISKKNEEKLKIYLEKKKHDTQSGNKKISNDSLKPSAT